MPQPRQAQNQRTRLINHEAVKQVKQGCFFQRSLHVFTAGLSATKGNGREAEASRPLCVSNYVFGPYQLMRQTIWPMRPPGSNVVLMSV